MNPLVSVVIPSYNRGYCIEECIRSVQEQSYSNWEVIVVDDASNDDTRARVSAIQDSRVHYVLHEHNQGGSAARNTGIRHSHGEYIAFLDSDDRWMPDKLEKQMTGLIAAGEQCGFSYTWLVCVDSQDRELVKMTASHDGDCHQTILISNFIGTFSCVVIRRDMLSLVGCLDEAMRSCQDWDLFIRLMRVTQVHCVPECLVRYRHVGGDGVRISLNPASVVQGHRRILHKFSAEYHALPVGMRREARRVYFNIFVSAGAFGEALRTGCTMLPERANPADVGRGLFLAAKKSLRRRWLRWRMALPQLGNVSR